VTPTFETIGTIEIMVKIVKMGNMDSIGMGN